MIHMLMMKLTCHCFFCLIKNKNKKKKKLEELDCRYLEFDGSTQDIRDVAML